MQTNALTSPQAKNILDDVFRNLMHDSVAGIHRDVKISATRSVINVANLKLAQEKAKAADVSKVDITTNSPNGASAMKSAGSAYEITRIETDAVLIADGQIYLKVNPLQFAYELTCSECHRPRLMYPTSGAGGQAPPYPEKEYCLRQPFICKDGHDVHGNPFATDKVSKRGKKKETTVNPSASSSPSMPSTPAAAGSFKASTLPDMICYPTVKCPNCTRYLIVTRIAQHLDKCLGISSRLSSRNAMTKMSTPQESRASTPKPAGSKRARGADGDGEKPKKKKKLGTPKKVTGKKPMGPSKLKNGVTQQK